MQKDHFADKSTDWDTRPVPLQISAAVGPLLRSSLDWDDGMQVMDFGAGTGLLTSHVAPLVAKVVAVDTSPSMLESLAEKQELRDVVEPRCQDILIEPLGEQFDAIVSAMALHHVQDTDRLFGRFREHLKPGGQLALADLDTEDGSFHPPDTVGVYHHGFDREELGRKLEAAGFEAVRFQTAAEVTREDGRTYPVFLATARARPAR
ncbi:MAG TPA: methyltransferase domain-containing protein [Steroidobacteraceae bacterium]|nr:methyltransferase domain-containing protein [Steroidobacteraceae bacterium]